MLLESLWDFWSTVSSSLCTWRLTGPEHLSETLACPQERRGGVDMSAWCGVWKPGVSSQQYT